MPRLANWNYWDALKRAVRVLVAQGYTARELAEELNRQQICTASGKRWTESTMQWALHRRLGLSTVHYTRHLPLKSRRNQKMATNELHFLDELRLEASCVEALLNRRRDTCTVQIEQGPDTIRLSIAVPSDEIASLVRATAAARRALH